MASASTIGRPVAAAAAIGISELPPPISIGIRAVARRPMAASAAVRASVSSETAAMLSLATEGAPIMPMGTTKSRSVRESVARTGTGPYSRISR